MHGKLRTRRRNRGGTLVEVLTTVGLSTMVLAATVMLLIFGMASWLRGTAKISAESDAQGAVRAVASELRHAMRVDVGPGGTSVTYRLPTTDSEGNYITPAVWDGVTRRIELVGSELRMVGPTGTRVLARRIINTDPYATGTPVPYRIFTEFPTQTSPAIMIRQVTVQLVTRTGEYRQETAVGRGRETIFLRNIPEISRG